MRLMLVAHGAHHSTFDIYNYYKHSLSKVNDVVSHSFPYHMAMDYHFAALKGLGTVEDDKITVKAIFGASRDIATDILFFQPTTVMFISGLAIPMHIVETVYNMRNVLINPYLISYLFTESPYEDSDQEKRLIYSDCAFFNDKYSAQKYNPDGEMLIKYLPHAYFPSVHYAYPKVDIYTNDVLFCGTLYPNRVDWLNSINFDGVNAHIIGVYSDYMDGDKIRGVNVSNKHLDNIDLAELYRKTKVTINIHRKGEKAYSTNPRIREAIMCGCLPITDFRQEIIDEFGDTIPIFSSSHEAESHIKRLAKNDDERTNRLNAARSIIEKDTYEERLKKTILPMLREGEEINGKVSRQKC